MQRKFYQNIFKIAALSVSAIQLSTTLNAQVGPQGLKVEPVQYVGDSAYVKVKAISLSNVIGISGSINFDNTSLFLSNVTAGANACVVMGSPADVATLSGTFGADQANGKLTYLISEPATNAVNIATDKVLFIIKFKVINNPLNTFNSNCLSFSNSPTGIEVDTADAIGLPVQVLYPALENHVGACVSFARPAYLTQSGGDITDTVTNRPAGCSYQWFNNGTPISGPASSNFPGAPTGLDSVVITYPNGTVATGSTASILPVKLSKFSGKNIENANQLAWSTASEVGTTNFVIERSENGKDFYSIGKQNAVGNSSVERNYTFNDANISNKTTLYYRLKINDNNGSYSYSSVVKISKDTKATISLYPNPSKDAVKVTGEKIERITITSVIGKTMFTKTYDFVSTTTLNVSTFAKGIYNVNIISAEGNKTSKLIVE